MKTLASRLLMSRSVRFRSAAGRTAAVWQMAGRAASTAAPTGGVAHQQEQVRSPHALFAAAGAALLASLLQDENHHAKCCGIAGVVSSAKAGHDARYVQRNVVRWIGFDVFIPYLIKYSVHHYLGTFFWRD